MICNVMGKNYCNLVLFMKILRLSLKIFIMIMNEKSVVISQVKKLYRKCKSKSFTCKQ